MKKILTALCLLATAGAWAAPQLIAHRGGTRRCAGKYPAGH
ncbi:glycerophosphoryl diester phosphodiesterase [Klebsiella pneumoniae]|uniref:Glycerophosphoryl diester phosphodiesterase n=1 Tax=Klebsiella pneumoniae TaxID=573 RepID=A0A2X3GKP4_KLEPN|nr:glycerophosphoryl diester phosphodiesterase [Klebsiella pneumoniae]